MTRTSPCTPDIRRGRLRKSGQFLDAASLIADQANEEAEIADAYVTLCVHAGIAASDAICCARLGQHARGEDHSQAVAMLTKADDSSAKHLQVLLGMKTKVGYSHKRATAEEAKRAGRAAEALVEAARRVNAG
jgi:hypothetical protein